MLSSTMSDADRGERDYYMVGGCGGNIAWHTEGDTLEIADRDVLLRDMRVCAASLLRVLNAPLRPFDGTRATAEFRRTLGRYQQAVGEVFDFGSAGAALDAPEAALGAFYEGGPARGTPKAAAVKRFNAAQRRVGRLLIPVHDSRMPRFWHDPAIDVPPLPDLAPALAVAGTTGDAARRGMLRAHLTRGPNRFIRTLEQATDIPHRWTILHSPIAAPSRALFARGTRHRTARRSGVRSTWARMPGGRRRLRLHLVAVEHGRPGPVVEVIRGVQAGLRGRKWSAGPPPAARRAHAIASRRAHAIASRRALVDSPRGRTAAARRGRRGLAGRSGGAVGHDDRREEAGPQHDRSDDQDAHAAVRPDVARSIVRAFSRRYEACRGAVPSVTIGRNLPLGLWCNPEPRSAVRERPDDTAAGGLPT
jgi:hypothetical protein